MVAAGPAQGEEEEGVLSMASLRDRCHTFSGQRVRREPGVRERQLFATLEEEEGERSLIIDLMVHLPFLVASPRRFFIAFSAAPKKGKYLASRLLLTRACTPFLQRHLPSPLLTTLVASDERVSST